MLKEKLTALKELDDVILDLIEDDTDIDTEIEQADTWREKVQLALCEIEDVLKSPIGPRALEPPPTTVTVADPTATPTTTPPSTTASTVTASTTSTDPTTTSSMTTTSADPTIVPSAVTRTTKVRLPKITLRRFDGNPLQWTTFWDTFKSTVHDSPELTKIDKFNYLYSLLERSAAEAISGLALTSANYQEAIAILQRRFGDRQQIIGKHMETLLNLEPVTTYSVKCLRQLYDKVESHIRSLKALGISTESYGSLLTSTLLSKVPADIRLTVSRSITDGDWNLDTLMKKLGEEIEARERATTAQVHTQPMPNKKSRDFPATRTMLSSDACSYCDQGHSSSSCTTVTDIESRKQILKKSGRCFNCLRRHHMSRDCRSATRCQHCNGRHHTSICQKRHDTTTSTSSSTPTTQSTTQASLPTHGSRSTSMYTDVRTPVLLQTAKAIVANPDQPECQMVVRVIFDGGSQRSYITQEVRQQLNLSAEAIETEERL